MNTAKTKSKFVKYLGTAHINNLNIALYDSGAVRVEQVVNDKSLGAKQFQNTEEAEGWFESFNGDNMSRLTQAISSLTSIKY
jgi:hypothetical protein